MPGSEREQVFISYSRRDRKWLERLQTTLAPLVRGNAIDVWADSKIQPGQNWKRQIEEALARAKVAVLLVSQEFLASDFISDEEMPAILDGAETEGLTIVWVPVTACLYEATAIAGYQPAHSPDRPLDSLDSAELSQALVEIARHISAAGRLSPAAAEEKVEPPVGLSGSEEGNRLEVFGEMARSQLRLGLLSLLARWPAERKAPNLTEICRTLDIRSRKSAYETVRYLSFEGLIERAGEGKAMWRLSERGREVFERLRRCAKIEIVTPLD